MGHGCHHGVAEVSGGHPGGVREQMGLKAGQKLQVVPLPGRIELVPVAAPGALRGFVAGPNNFDRDLDRPLDHG